MMGPEVIQHEKVGSKNSYPQKERDWQHFQRSLECEPDLQWIGSQVPIPPADEHCQSIEALLLDHTWPHIGSTIHPDELASREA